MNKSKVFETAWQFYKQTGESFSLCLTKSWRYHKLVAALRKGIIKFYYQKVDGSLREAWGTLNEERIPHTEESNRRHNPTLQTYFDTEKREWRSFKIINIVKN